VAQPIAQDLPSGSPAGAVFGRSPLKTIFEQLRKAHNSGVNMRVTLYALVMAFGALVAGIGLVLLFRKQEQSLSKMRIFGQEFQFSAPGLVVTLAGCVLVILLPVLEVNDKDVIVFGSGSNDGSHPGPNLAVTVKEYEPNGNFDTANVIKFGTTTKGVLTTSKDRDFFKFQVPATLSGLPKVRVILEKSFDASVRIYDDNEEKVGDMQMAFGDNPVSFSFESTPGAYYYVVVDSYAEGRGEYKVILRQE
jgi:hypothetical protein